MKYLARLFVAALLLVATIAICQGEDTGYRVKAVMVGNGHLEAKFVVMPDDLRLVCNGDTKGISTGDYVRVEIKDHVFVIGKTTCEQIKWYH